MNTLIIAGGNNDINFSKEYLEKYSFDLIIAADKGLEVLDNLNIIPNYIIGDFDSLNNKTLEKYKEKNTKIITLNPEKDYTDTHMALKLAIEEKSNKITILGAIGNRIDHTIANINILKEALNKKVKAKLVDLNNEIFLTDKTLELKKDNRYKYISLIPLTTEVKKVTLKGFKYPLYKANLKLGESLGISNEQQEDNAKIEISRGVLIVIKSKD